MHWLLTHVGSGGFGGGAGSIVKDTDTGTDTQSAGLLHANFFSTSHDRRCSLLDLWFFLCRCCETLLRCHSGGCQLLQQASAASLRPLYLPPLCNLLSFIHDCVAVCARSWCVTPAFTSKLLRASVCCCYSSAFLCTVMCAALHLLLLDPPCLSSEAATLASSRLRCRCSTI